MKARFTPFIIVLTALCFFSCGNDKSSASSTKKVFKYNQPEDITHLDPAFAKSMNNIWATHHLYNGLVQLDENLNVKPSIADSWEFSNGGKTITFNLRSDVYFHDHELFPEGKGRKVVAQDFVYSLNRIQDQSLGSPGSWVLKAVASKNPFIAKDEQTFVINLEEAFGPFLGILSMQYCSVVPKEIVEHYKESFRSNPIGTGPFKLKTWSEGQGLFLEKNPRYFEKGLPKLDAVKVSFITDRKMAFLEFKQGNLDYLSSLESSFLDELLTKDGKLQDKFKDQVELINMPFLNTEYLGINMANPNNPLKDKLVRQALNYGFDRELMIKQLRNSVGKAADSGFTPRGLPSYNPASVKGYSYNPEKAKELLAKAGYPNGKGLPTIQLTTTSNYLDLCTFITRQWEELGVKVNIEVEESSALRNKIKAGEVDFFRGSWIADYADAENYMACFYGEQPAPPNYTQFKNKRFDQLYRQVYKDTDEELRKETFHKMEKILIEESPAIFLFYDEASIFVQKNISGISKNAIKLLDLKRVDKQ